MSGRSTKRAKRNRESYPLCCECGQLAFYEIGLINPKHYCWTHLPEVFKDALQQMQSERSDE